MKRIYHITTAETADRAAASGEYTPEGFAREGFIHCSYAHQLAGVLKRFFRERTGLVVLEIDRAMIEAKIVSENLEGGSEQFPHLYGALPMSAVVGIHDLSRGLTALPGFHPVLQDVTRYEVNAAFNKAVLSFNDGSYLTFEHTSRQNRWAKASAEKTIADRTCLALQQFRLNAKHLQLFFEDGSDAEFNS